MMFDGKVCRRAKHLTFRDSNPATDRDLSGNPVACNYVAIVKKSRCQTYTLNGKEYLDPKTAPAIPIDHGGTNYGYGKARKYCGYITIPVYIVLDGKVWMATIKRKEK